ncbi:hypothetical protein GEMRC1_005435 [Eukaryota sp. GEM-RC1]
MPTLLYFMGVPGSGKTHFSRQLCERLSFIHYSSDYMRHCMFSHNSVNLTKETRNTLVFEALNYALSAALKAGCDVVYDANHERREDRMRTQKLAHDIMNVKTCLIWLKVPLDDAIKRGCNRTICEHSPITTKEKVLRHASELEEPLNDESHIVIDGMASFEEQFASFESQFEALYSRKN